MRLTLDANSPDYYRKFPWFNSVDVFLDGKKLLLCQSADDVAGTAMVYVRDEGKTGYLRNEDGTLLQREVHGIITFKFYDREGAEIYPPEQTNA
jgi:hypothetical protein